jgi:hypothetical protein
VCVCVSMSVCVYERVTRAVYCVRVFVYESV